MTSSPTSIPHLANPIPQLTFPTHTSSQHIYPLDTPLNTYIQATPPSTQTSSQQPPFNTLLNTLIHSTQASRYEKLKWRSGRRVPNVYRPRRTACIVRYVWNPVWLITSTQSWPNPDLNLTQSWASPDPDLVQLLYYNHQHALSYPFFSLVPSFTFFSLVSSFLSLVSYSLLLFRFISLLSCSVFPLSSALLQWKILTMLGRTISYKTALKTNENT